MASQGHFQQTCQNNPQYLETINKTTFIDSSKQLEEILLQFGKWGKFQYFYYLCLGFAVVFSVFTMNYIFLARDIKYRCLIEECDLKTQTYNTNFLPEYVPFRNGLPERCLRYQPYSAANRSDLELCSNNSKISDSSITIKCSKFVFERKEFTIVHDFGIFCPENLWKLTVVGTISISGELVSLAYSGFLSDRYGRKTIMCASLLMSSLSGLLKSFSLNYSMFLVFEFMDTALGGATYGAAFVLAMELVTAKDRNLGNTIISCVYALGQVIFGLLAIPLWIFLPESLRWLVSKHKSKEAIDILHHIARVNGREIYFEDTQGLQRAFDKSCNEEEHSNASKQSQSGSFLDVLKHPVLLIRSLHCSLTWICCNFVFYGLTIHSVDVSESIYLSFIFSAVAETPGYVIYYYANEKWGRRRLMSSTLILGGAFCLAVGFLPESWMKLVAFFCGKCCLTIAYTVLYGFTIELFPTSSRHAMFSMCSMFGRFGSMVSPQIPILVRISKLLPLFLFSFMATTFGILALCFPETSHVPLPHTIEEAVHIGKHVRSQVTK
ncbi:solute carrier family 22 member 21-like isoform X2 [Euwallacea fornicatus]|uniref:solute carrier family 22 member 21-like isoform X2 n=1 Tax=Euwallacea fornicatus TaxID=995702 RepID=UPI00338DED29